MVGAEGFRLTNFHLESCGEGGTVVYCLSNLILEYFGGVGGGNLEVVFIYKILYFGFILLYRVYDSGVSFIG
jgi:hypothetical protein